MSARGSDLFADIPNGCGAALRALAEDTGARKGTALENALGADITAIDDASVRRNLIRTAIRVTVSESERAAIKALYSGPQKSKIVLVSEFNAWCKEYPIRRVSQIPAGTPSATPGHNLFFTGTGADGKPALMAVNFEGETYPVLTGSFTVTETISLRHVGRDSELGSAEGGAYVTKYVSPDGDETVATVDFADIKAREPKFPETTGIATRIAPSKIKSVTNAIAALGQNAPRRTAIAGTGPLRVGDGYVFLRQNKSALTATGFNDDYRAIIATVGEGNGIHFLDFADPSAPDEELTDFLNYLRIADATPDEPHIAICALSALAWSPCGPIVDLLPVNFLIHAETGKRKTSLAGLTTAAQSSHNLHLGENSEPPVACNMRDGQTTTFAADQLLYHMRGTFAAVDDLFAGRMSANEEAKQWKFISTNGRNASTGSGGARGAWSNSGGSVPSVKFPRSSNFYTAEKLPDEQGHSGALAAIAVVKMEREVRTDVLTELQEIANTGAFGRAHSSLIRATLPNFDMHRDALKTAMQVAESWERSGHNRTQIQWRRILAGAYVLSARYGQLTGDDPRKIGDDFAELIHEAQARQAQRSGMRSGTDITINPVRLFVRYMKQALNTGTVFLASRDMKIAGQMSSNPGNRVYSAPNMPDGFAPSDVGWRVTATDGYVSSGGTPIGALLKYEGRGARPPEGFEHRAFVKKAEWQTLYDAIATMSLAGRNVSLPSPEEMLSLLAKDSRYVLSTEAQKAKEIFGRTELGYSFNILSILRGEMPEDGPEDGPEDEAEADPGPDDAPPAPGADARIGARITPGGNAGDRFARESIPGTEPPPVKPSASGLEPDAKPSRGKRAKEPAESPAPHLAAALGVSPDGTGLSVYFRADQSGPMGSNRGPFAVPDIPKSLAECYRLARRYALAELWIHPSAMRMIGLPSANTVGDTPGESIPNKWGKTTDDLEREAKYAGTVSGWMPVWRADIGRKGSEVAIVVPAYDSRNQFGSADSAQEMICAVELFNTALARDVRFRWSPNPTMKTLSRRVSPKYRTPVHSITRDEVPAITQHSQLLGIDWDREPVADELRSGFLIIDRNAAEISGFETDYIGFGEPDNFTSDVRFKRGTAGYYRLSRQVTGYDSRLPALTVRPGSDHSLWVAAPDAELLDSLGILPPLAEAWLFPESGRYLSGMYGALRKGRETLNETREASGGNVARTAYSAAWHSFIGELANTRGARGDDDNTFRPDIRDAIKAETYARMYRGLVKIAETSGRYPIATHADAVVYTANNESDIPDGARIDSRIGSYKVEKYLTGKWNHGDILPWRS